MVKGSPAPRQDIIALIDYTGSAHLRTFCSHFLSRSALADWHITKSLAVRAGYLSRVYELFWVRKDDPYGLTTDQYDGDLNKQNLENGHGGKDHRIADIGSVGRRSAAGKGKDGRVAGSA